MSRPYEIATENEANYFAAHLLVPTEMLRQEVQSLGGIDLSGDGKALRTLARKFRVSEELIAFRLGEETKRP